MTVSVTFTEGSVEEVFSGTLTVDVEAVADDPTITVETQADVATSTEYMQLTDAPSLGFMQVYQNGNWVNMLTGVNYEVTDDLQTVSSQTQTPSVVKIRLLLELPEMALQVPILTLVFQVLLTGEL